MEMQEKSCLVLPAEFLLRGFPSEKSLGSQIPVVVGISVCKVKHKTLEGISLGIPHKKRPLHKNFGKRVLMDDEIDEALIVDSGLTREQLQELLEIFRLVDTDQGGTISKEELETLMKTCGLRASKVELETMIDEIDVEGKGEIDFRTFVAAMSRKVNTSVTPDMLKSAFKRFSAEKEVGDGLISMETMIEILTEYGENKKIPRDEVDELINSIAPQINPEVFDWKNFVRMYLAE